MSCQDVPTFQHLVIQRLLGNEDLAVSALEDLPSVFFPQLFKEAFTKSRRKIVKHLIATWPYPNLYIGPLKCKFQLYNIKGVFDAIDWLTGEKVWPRRCRLKELYLLDVRRDFLIIMKPRRDHLYIPQPQPGEEDTTTVLKKPITVFFAESAFMADSLKHYCDFLEQEFNKRLNTMSLNFKEMAPQKKAEIE